MQHVREATIGTWRFLALHDTLFEYVRMFCPLTFQERSTITLFWYARSIAPACAINGPNDSTSQSHKGNAIDVHISAKIVIDPVSSISCRLLATLWDNLKVSCEFTDGKKECELR
jgi:hypothetical protein